MPNYVKFHGLKLADNSYIENMRIEQLSADPTPTEPGRLWYNTTDKVFKFSSLDAQGAVQIQQAVSLAELQAEVATLNASITAESTARQAADTNLQNQIDTVTGNLDAHDAQITITVTNDASNSYLLDGSANQSIDIHPGITYKFELNVSTHPFLLLDAAVTSNFSANYYNEGLSHDDGAGNVVTGANAQGQTSGTLIFKVPHDAPDTLYYVCENHPSTMKGVLSTSDFPAEAQAELDAIETGAGLQSDGSYLANGTTTYLTGATSLKNADELLDAAIDGVQGELDATQNGAGLGSTGVYTANGSANYINTATSLKDADDKLDTQAKTNADDIAQEITDRISADTTINTTIATLQTEVNTTQTGAGLNADGSYTANGSANYISSATDLQNADDLLDTQVKTNADDIVTITGTTIPNLQFEVDVIENSVGLTASGGFVAFNGTNYINLSTSIADSIGDLDTAVGNVQSELDASQTGAGLNANGSYSANNTAQYINTATSLKDADNKLSVAIYANETAITGKVSKTGDTMSGNLDMGTNRIISVATPVDPTDAANKEYVDSVATGLDVKASVRVASTANVANLTSVTTIDGIALADGDRVLLKDQTTASQNGIYEYSAAGNGSLSRASDADDNAEMTSGVFVFVEEGTANADNGYVLVTDGSITVGSSAMVWEQFSGAGQIIAGAGIQKNGNEIFLNFGAGVVELPSDEVGLDLRSDSGLFLTLDGAADSTDTAAQLSVKIDGNTLSKSSSGLRVDASVISDISTNTTDITNLQTEVDAIEVGAGLSPAGSYSAIPTANYISNATSLKDADNLLDIQIKQNADDIATLNNSVGAGGIQGELDNTQAGAGLLSTGAYNQPSGSNYIDTATSLANADSLLDTAIKDNFDSLESLILDVESDLSTEIAQRTSGDSSIRTSVNNLRFTYQSTATATTHTINHNLNSNHLLFQVMVLDDQGVYANDVVPVEETNANTLTIYLTESRHIRVSVMSMTNI